LGKYYDFLCDVVHTLTSHSIPVCSFSYFAELSASSSSSWSEMSHLDNIFIQVRARLQSEGVKLWEEPYYSEDLGSIEGALEVQTW